MRPFVVPVLVLLAFGALGCTGEDPGCTSSSGEMADAAPTQTGPLDPPGAPIAFGDATGPGRTAKLVAGTGPMGALVAFARLPSEERWARIPFADEVELGLGLRLTERVAAHELADLASWQVNIGAWRGWGGPFSALQPLRAKRRLRLVRGPHLRCQPFAVQVPERLERYRQLSVQPTGIDSWLEWFSVDAFVDRHGRIRAVVLDLCEP